MLDHSYHNYIARHLVYCSDWDGLMDTFEMREGKEPSDFLQVSFHLLRLIYNLLLMSGLSFQFLNYSDNRPIAACGHR